MTKEQFLFVAELGNFATQRVSSRIPAVDTPSITQLPIAQRQQPVKTLQAQAEALRCSAGILELKREVNELLKRRNEPSRYHSVES